MAAAIQAAGIAYAALGPAQPEVLDSFAVIPEAIAAAQNIFFSGVMADARFGISLPAVQACAEVITRCSPITPDGFANLRFAALANVKPGSPFFPAAYHDQDEPAFSIATEAADLAVKAFTNARTVSDGQRTLTSEIEKHARELAQVGDELKPSFFDRVWRDRLLPGAFPVRSRLHRRGHGTDGCAGSRIAWFAGCCSHPDGNHRARPLPPNRIQRVDAAGPGGCGSGPACRRGTIDGQRPAALFRRLRHRAGYRPVAGRYQRQTRLLRCCWISPPWRCAWTNLSRPG